MRLKRNAIAVLLWLGLSIVSAVLKAEISDLYAQLHLGSATSRGLSDAIGGVEDQSMGYRVAAGLMLSRYLGVEAGFADLGAYDINSGLSVGEWKAQASDISIMGHLPLKEMAIEDDNWRVRLGFGLTQWRSSVSQYDITHSVSGTGTRFGIELGYRLNRVRQPVDAMVVKRQLSYELSLGWSRYGDVGEGASHGGYGNSDIDLWLAGLRVTY
ncbi:hypothetical protein D5085_11805 [Ectothiorhodospiraceae bacterium BW-2]|nr:hypothetical protein D5085_11805 [Ectothiorhodospiraceae bacterium BW-2]